MVKLFVGNLADSVDSHRLRNLFLQYVTVQECDVLKNFAFVHVINEDDAQIVIDKLDKHKLEGREIHIERSTSRLRKEPGMSDKCFTCGATDHKTPSCPKEQERRKANKRPGDPDENVESKKPVVLPPINLAGGTPVAAPTTAPQCWGYKVGGGSDADPELPCPTNPELRTLYDQYLESRTRYFFYRERLAKELSLQPGGAAASAVTAAATHVGRIDLTRHASAAVPVATATSLAAPPVAYSIPQAVSLPGQVAAPASLISATPSAPYNASFRGVAVNAPYASSITADTASNVASVYGAPTAAPAAYTVSHYNTVPQLTQQAVPNVLQAPPQSQLLGQPQTALRPQPGQQPTLAYGGTPVMTVMGQQPAPIQMQTSAISSQPYQPQAAPSQLTNYTTVGQPPRVQLSAPYQQSASAPYQTAIGGTSQSNGISWRDMKAEPQY